MAIVTSTDTRRVVVVGGGISGLAAAHRLFELRSQRDDASLEDARLEVVLLEASARVGGVVRTFRREGFLLEGGPDAYITEKPAARKLAERIGLAHRIIETNEQHRRSFVVSRGRLHPTPEGFQMLAPSRFLPFITTGIFTWRGKARVAFDLFLPRGGEAGGGREESLAGFVRRRFGREALERMAQPLAGGIYTADPELLSLRATFPRFLEMEREHRSLLLAMWRARSKAPGGGKASGARYQLFQTFDEGTQVLTDALAARLPEGTIRLNTRVESINFDHDTRRWLLKTSGGLKTGDGDTSYSTASGSERVEANAERETINAGATNDGETLSADAVCLALPAYASARLLRGVDDELAAELERIPYASTATVNLAYRRSDIPHPLDGFGFVVPFIERRAVLACTFSSVKFKARAPEGCELLRAFVGGALQPEMFALDEERMLEAVRRDLRELLGINAPPLFAHIERWPRSMAQYHVGHLELVSRINRRLQRHPTLALCGNAYTGAGLPDCVRTGETAADSLIKQLFVC